MNHEDVFRQINKDIITIPRELAGEYYKTIEIYLKSGFDVDIIDRYGKPFLHRVLDHDRNDIKKIKLLIRYGVNVNARCRKTGDTALHKAVLFANDQVMKLLLENGANPLLINNQGFDVFDILHKKIELYESKICSCEHIGGKFMKCFTCMILPLAYDYKNVLNYYRNKNQTMFDMMFNRFEKRRIIQQNRNKKARV